MTIQTACDQASKRLRSGLGLSAVYTSADPFAIELADLANEVATDIMKRHDWRKLVTLETQGGDGATTAFSLPDDYDRMPVKAKVYRSLTTRPMKAVLDLDEWLENRLETFSDPSGEWIILGGSLNVYPAMASTDSAKYYYVSNLIVAPNSGSNKTAFTLDNDTFRLPERLITLGLIWRWRHMKGYDYAEDMQNFELALAQEIARDKGSRVLHVGPARMPDANLAYPQVIET